MLLTLIFWHLQAVCLQKENLITCVLPQEWAIKWYCQSTALSSSVVWMQMAYENLSGFTDAVGTFNLRLAWEV